LDVADGTSRCADSAHTDPTDKATPVTRWMPFAMARPIATSFPTRTPERLQVSSGVSLAVNVQSSPNAEEEKMRRIAVLTSGMFLALGLAVGAQDTTVKSTTKTSGGEIKTVSYTGCVGAGTETRTYVLSKVVPVSRTTAAIGTTGTTTVTETSYVLVPDQTVQVQEHVGHKVEVTGAMIPAGDIKSQTKTKIERNDAKDTTVKEKTKADNAMARFRVTSIKDLGERCE
jgi:hypothetical protein